MQATEGDPAEQFLVGVRQIRLLYQNLEYGVKLSMLGAIVILLAIRARGPLPTSIAWWGGITIFWVAAGFVVHYFYSKLQPRDHDLKAWGQRAAGGSAVAGAIWGSIGFC